MTKSPHLKICGLTRHVDARAAADAGASYGGVILAPGHSRSVDLAAAAAVLGDFPLRRVGVFVDPDPVEVARAIDRLALSVVQLHGDEPPEFAAQLRSSGPATVWKAIRVRSADDLLAGIERYAGTVDGLLLDGWSASGHGGTGSRFGWEEAAEHRGTVPPGVELIVAGGLRPDNVAHAAGLLRPDTVDVSSGVESERGIKDHLLIRAFVAAIREPAVNERSDG